MLFSGNSHALRYFLTISVFFFIACSGDTPTRNEVQPQGYDSNNTAGKLLITGVEPGFGLAGSKISIGIDGNVIGPDVVVKLKGKSIIPDSIEGNRVVFTVPEDAESGPLKVVQGESSSNIVWFAVTQNGVVEPAKDKIVVDELGNRVAIDYLLVSLKEDSDTREEADRLAAMVSGIVVGRISMVNGWQIRVNVDSLEALEAVAETLRGESSVKYALIDTEVKNDSVNWSGDPDRTFQRSRNKVEEGAALYEREVHPTKPGKIRPFFISIGVSEAGIEYPLPDFSGYGENGSTSSGNVSIYASNVRDNHGSNVVGIIAAELGDRGNAGIINALSGSHGGANVSVNAGWGGVLGRISGAEQQLEAGALVVNWSWGLHKTKGRNCLGEYVSNNLVSTVRFLYYSKVLKDFFEKLAAEYPDAVIVSTAGNGATNAGDGDFRLPSSIESEQLIVVGAHTTNGTIAKKIGSNISIYSEDELARGVCFDEYLDAGVKRADYSNYGRRVDIAASGSIMGIDNDPHIAADLNGNGKFEYSNRGTSYAAPLVTATVALMQSINPNLSPAEIKTLLRKSASPIENKVVTSSGVEVFTRPLTAEESPSNVGKGARLNVKGAIQAAIDSLERETLSIANPVTVSIPKDTGEITRTISVTIPSDEAVFDKVDIMFLVDVSGSYRDDIDTFRSRANELIAAFESGGKNVNIGVASFSDFPSYGASYDYAFSLDQALTSSMEGVIAAINALPILYGGDSPESQLEALFQVAQPDTGWRSGSLPIIFLATDAGFHDSDEEADYPGAGYTETLSVLTSKGIRVFGLQSGGTVADVTEIASATGGEAFSLSRDSSEIISAVSAAIGSTTSNFSVRLVPNGDFAGMVKSVKPSGVADANDGDPAMNVNPGDTVSFDVVFSKGYFDDKASRTFSFRLKVIADDVAEIQDIPVTVLVN